MIFDFFYLIMDKYLNNLYPLKIVIFLFLLFYTKSISKSINSSLRVFIISTFASLTSVILKLYFAHELKEIIPIGINTEQWNIIRKRTFAFPSGHIIIATTFILSFIIELIQAKKNSFNKNIILYLFTFFLIFFNAYRILYFKYHILSDIVFGLFVSFCNIFIFYKFTILHNKKKTIYLFFISWLLFFIALGLSYYRMKRGGSFEIKFLTISIIFYHFHFFRSIK